MSLAFTLAASTSLFTRDTSPLRQASNSSLKAPLTAGTPGPGPAAPGPSVAVLTPAASGLSAKLDPGEDGVEDEDEVGEEEDDGELLLPPPVELATTPTADEVETAGTTGAAAAPTVQIVLVVLQQLLLSTGSGDRGLSGGSRLPSPSGSVRPCRGEKGARPPAVGEAGVVPGAKPGLSGGGGGGGGPEAPGAGWSCC